MSDTVRYRAVPFQTVRAREGNRLISLPLTGERRIVPEGMFAVLDRLRGFRTLAEHAEGLRSDLRKSLEDLRRHGLLMSEEEFFRAAAPREATPCAPLSTIAIPTSGGSRPLNRCRESYSAHATKYGHGVRFVVAGAGQTLNADLAAEMRRSGIDPALTRFALSGEADDLPAGIGPSIGANRNALLLACAGEAFLAVDDDTICSFRCSPEPRVGLAVSSAGNPDDLWFGPELPASLPADIDILAEAGRALGPVVGAAKTLLPFDFDHTTMVNLCRGVAKARVVQLGLNGDSATASPAGWLSVTGPARERLVSTEAAYRAAMASRRLFAAVPCETLSFSRQLMSYCIALDHREPLPPFPPLGRDEDGVFGAWLRIVEPDSFTVHLPYAVSHEPTEERTFPPFEQWLPSGMALNDVLHLLSENADPGAAEDRTRALGLLLRDMAGLSRADFEALLIERRLRYLSRRIAFFESALKAFGSKPVWWVNDIRGVLRATEEEMAGTEILRFAERSSRAPGDPVAVWQTYVRWCGRLICEWSAMREVALARRQDKSK